VGTLFDEIESFGFAMARIFRADGKK